MEILINVGIGKAATVAPGKRAALVFDVEWNDPEGVHANPAAAWLPKESGLHVTTLTVTVSGQTAGEKLKLSVAEFTRDGKSRVKDLVGEDKVGNGTKVEYTLTGLVSLWKDKSYRAEVENFGTSTVTVEKAYLKVAK
ncbi:hypothetical protein LO762_17485 [Actinocorallia sp. API 0066]|uniref:hypothetical protein n=1 Tax=Actinocorallia sp. API 0066 TaxID=2896846 RepID=UPI001E61C31C|nr:hypothetical protein [Actinocorallia sp. API 0066]MCD0450974.1 hypothetical protein [Actinocorallia sp. API 0066]